MPLLNNLNQKDGDSIIGSLTEPVENIDEKVVVHTMPKRFLSAQKTEKKVKNAGVIILIIGSIFLLAVLGLLFYYLYTAEQTPTTTNNLHVGAQLKATTTEEKVENNKPEENINTEENNQSPEQVQATTTNQTIVTTSPIEQVQIATATEITNNPASSTTINNNTPQPVKIDYQTPVDSDSDGLFDTEEVLLDANQNASDSDGDGYNDLIELTGLFNPAGSGKLLANPNIEKYINNQYNYYVYYPKQWKINDKIGADSVSFDIGNNQFVQIMVQQNPEPTLDDWYIKQFAGLTITDKQRMYKKGWAGIKNDDGLVVYLQYPENKNVFIVSYNLGTENVLKYKNIFETMINSLEIGK
jgi:hypothetical protein